MSPRRVHDRDFIPGCLKHERGARLVTALKGCVHRTEARAQSLQGVRNPLGSLQQDETEFVSLWVTHDLKEVCWLLMDDPVSRCP